MKKTTHTSMLRVGIVLICVGLLRLLNERLGIPRQQMRDTFVQSLPYLWPILLITIGSILVVWHINRDDIGK